MKSYLKILIGNVLLTGAYTFLTVPNNIINGGVTSTSLLISHYFKYRHRLYKYSNYTFSIIIWLNYFREKIFY